MEFVQRSLLVLLLLFILISPLLAGEIPEGEDIFSYMIQLREELEEEYVHWLMSRLLYETSRRYQRSVFDVLTLYDEIFVEESPHLDDRERLERLGFEQRDGEWYFEGERIISKGRMITSSEVIKAYRDIDFGDSEALVREKLREDLGYDQEMLMPEITIAGEPFILTFNFYEDRLYQIWIQHKETRFTEDIFRFGDGVKYQDILFQVISSQYGAPSFYQEITFSCLEPPYDGRAAWSSIWGPEKTGGEKIIRIGINYVSFKGTLMIEYLPLAAKRRGITYIQDIDDDLVETDTEIYDSSKDF